MISIVIASLNEGSLLRDTISDIKRMVQNHEIIVVDDCSTDDAWEDLSDVTVLRNEKTQGVAMSRSRGASAASGKCLIFMDGHHRFQDSCLDSIAVDALHHNAIIWPCIQDLNGNDRANPEKYGHGSHIHIIPEGKEKGMIGFEWSKERSIDTLTRSTGLFVPYAMPSNIYEKVKWPEGLSGFGNTEKSVLLKSFFTDTPIYHKCGYRSYHLFRGRVDRGQPEVPYKISRSVKWRNQAVAVAVCFHRDTWYNYWWPQVFQKYVEDDVLSIGSIADQNEEFQLIMKKPDIEFWRGLLHQKPPIGVSNQ